MAYATAQDMIARWGEQALIQLSDRIPPFAGVRNDAVIGEALADAAAEIDAHVQARYPLPVSPTPRLLTRLCCDLAWTALHRDRPTDAVMALAKAARATLLAIARGDLALQDSTGAPASSDGVRVSGPERIFTSERLRDF